MLFSSIEFIFYFLPLVLIIYYALYFARPLQNLFLVIVSLLFYAWGEPKFVLLMLASIVVNYLLALIIDKVRASKYQSKFFLIIMLIFNLGILFIFKYLSFVSESVNHATGGKVEILDIALPIGISFFTFKAISYVIDVYRKDVKAQINPLNVALYISFFPQLLAGPITRYSDIELQIKIRKESPKKFSSGVCMFIIGLGKKVLIANNMAILVDNIYNLNNMGGIPVSLAWLGAIGYTLQIYFDFSGYSDMAIGLGLMFGFKFDKNFNYPYITKSISEFWRRWHISLGKWFRDYLYIPLGGSRVLNTDILIRNLAIVWILTGIWHGANWTFLIWGVMNFIFIALERMFNYEKSRIPKGIRHIYAMFVIIIGWVIFRADSLQEAGSYLGSMFNFVKYGFFSDYTYMFLKEYGIFLLAGILFSLPVAPLINQILVHGIRVRQIVEKEPPYNTHAVFEKVSLKGLVSVIYPAVMIGLFIICITYLVKGSYNPFIYFQF